MKNLNNNNNSILYNCPPSHPVDLLSFELWPKEKNLFDRCEAYLHTKEKYLTTASLNMIRA